MQVSTPLVLRALCRRCSKPRDPREFVIDPIVGYCWHCYEHHLKAQEMLAGKLPVECGGCQRKLRELNETAPGGDVRMRMQIKDGIYQLLCIPCSDDYEAKRSDLFGGTPYGSRLN